jgi:hypothetical protein
MAKDSGTPQKYAIVTFSCGIETPFVVEASETGLHSYALVIEYKKFNKISECCDHFVTYCMNPCHHPLRTIIPENFQKATTYNAFIKNLANIKCPEVSYTKVPPSKEHYLEKMINAEFPESTVKGREDGEEEGEDSREEGEKGEDDGDGLSQEYKLFNRKQNIQDDVDHTTP